MSKFIVVVLLLAITGSLQVDLPAILDVLPAIPKSEAALPETVESEPELLAVPERELPANMSDNLPLLGIVTASALNVRHCGSLKCKAVDWLYQGEQVVILENEKGWLRIGEGEWIYQRYIQIRRDHFARKH